MSLDKDIYNFKIYKNNLKSIKSFRNDINNNILNNKKSFNLIYQHSKNSGDNFPLLKTTNIKYESSSFLHHHLNFNILNMCNKIESFPFERNKIYQHFDNYNIKLNQNLNYIFESFLGRTIKCRIDEFFPMFRSVDILKLLLDSDFENRIENYVNITSELEIHEI